MYAISSFLEYLIKRPEREFIVKCEVGDQEYGMSSIVDFTIDSTLLYDDNFTIGTVIISKLMIKLKPQEDIPSGTRIAPYVAFNTDVLTWQEAKFSWQEAEFTWQGGPSEWIPLGEFYVDVSRKVNKVWEFECFDKLIWSEQPYNSQLSYPATMQAMWDEICTTAGYTYDNTIQINPSYVVEKKPEGMTMRQVMGYIAGANSASVRAGRLGQLQFKVFSAADSANITMTTADYVNVAHTNDIKTITRIIATYDEELDFGYEIGNGSADQTLSLFNPFITPDILNDMYARLNGFSYQPLEMDARGYPHIDVGDVMDYEKYDSLTWEEAYTTWEDTHSTWDGITNHRSVVLSMVLQYKGGFRMTLDAPSTSEQQNEYNVPGILTQKVDELNQTTTKLGKSYYGFKVSREDGLEIERSDGLSYLNLNSDIMDWQVEGESVLYLDALAKKLKFGGTLEGADGIFSGRLEAGEIVGSAIWGGVIRGSEMYGGYIATSESYPRVEMSTSANMFGAYQTANNYARLTPLTALSNDAAPGIEMKQGTSELAFGYGAGSLGGFGIYSSGIFEVQAMGGFYVNSLNVINWSFIRGYSIGGNGQSLQEALDGKADKSTVNASLSALQSRVQALEAAVGT